MINQQKPWKCSVGWREWLVNLQKPGGKHTETLSVWLLQGLRWRKWMMNLQNLALANPQKPCHDKPTETLSRSGDVGGGNEWSNYRYLSMIIPQKPWKYDDYGCRSGVSEWWTYRNLSMIIPQKPWECDDCRCHVKPNHRFLKNCVQHNKI